MGEIGRREREVQRGRKEGGGKRGIRSEAIHPNKTPAPEPEPSPTHVPNHRIPPSFGDFAKTRTHPQTLPGGIEEDCQIERWRVRRARGEGGTERVEHNRRLLRA